MSYACTHTPLTTRHLSISYCLRCQHWLLHWSASGRRSTTGEIVLIELEKLETLHHEMDDPYDAARWMSELLMGVIELEEDRHDTDALLGKHRLVDPFN